jgi:hypothetical protein
MTPRALLLCLLISACLSAGCSSGPSRHFDVVVRNKTPQPVMLWLSKDGPPVEKGWLTTEEFLETAPGEPSPGVDLPPDKIAHTAQSGHFPEGTHAILEIFSKPPASTAGGLTMRLQPGKTDLTLGLDPQGHLTAVDSATGSPMPPAPAPVQQP